MKLKDFNINNNISYEEIIKLTPEEQELAKEAAQYMPQKLEKSHDEEFKELVSFRDHMMKKSILFEKNYNLEKEYKQAFCATKKTWLHLILSVSIFSFIASLFLVITSVLVRTGCNVEFFEDLYGLIPIDGFECFLLACSITYFLIAFPIEKKEIKNAEETLTKCRTEMVINETYCKIHFSEYSKRPPVAFYFCDPFVLSEAIQRMQEDKSASLNDVLVDMVNERTE